MKSDPDLSLLEGDTQAAREQGFRKLIRSLALKGILSGIALFFLLGVFAPNLVDRRQDGALLLAVACLAASLAVVGWLAASCVREIRHYRSLSRRLTRLDRL